MATIHKLRTSAMQPDDVLRACAGLGFVSVAVIGFMEDGEPKLFSSELTVEAGVYGAQCLIAASMAPREDLVTVPPSS